MKRDATGRFVSSWKSETKQRVSISLTKTAWRSLDEESRGRGISRSEVIERFARSLNGNTLGHINSDAQIAALQKLVFEQQQTIAELQHQNHQLKAQIEGSPAGTTAPKTEHRVAVLETERAWFEAVLQQMPAGVMIADASGKLVLTNEQAKQIAGYDYAGSLELEEYAPLIPFSAFHPDRRLYAAEEYPLVRSLREGRVITNEEIEIQRADGSRILIRCNSTPILDHAGQIVAAVTIFQDVTERKRLESELEQQEQQFKLLVENAPDIISRLDQAFCHLYISPSIERITGISAERFIGRTNADLGMPEESYKTWCTVLQTVFDTGQEQTIEFSFPTSMGVRWYQSQIFPEFAKDNSVKTVLNIARDVTDYKQAEQALRESEEGLMLALKAAQMVSWDMDLINRWVVCSPNAINMWGLQEGPGEDFFAIIHPDDVQRIRYAAEQAVGGKTAYREEYRIISPNGTIRWLNSQGRVYLDKNGRGVRMTGVSVDITERKVIEANEMQARQQIEQLLRELQRKEQQQQFLIELNDVLRALQDSKETMWHVVCTTGQHFQVTRCTYGEIDSTQEYVIVDRDYCNGVISIVGKHHLDSFGSALIAELKQGKTIVVDDVDRDPRTAGAGAAAFAAIQTKSLLCVPLVKESRFVALLVLHHITPRYWTEDEVMAMERVAQKTWLAVERSRAEEELRRSEARLQLTLQEREQLLERERLARAQAEVAQSAQQFLSEASAVLASSLDYQTTLEQVAQLAVPKLADWCTVHIVEEDGSIAQIAITHIDPAKLEWAHRIQHKVPLTRDEPRGASFTLRTGQSDLIADISDEMLVQAAKDEEHLEILRQVGFSSVMTVPLRTQSRIIGVISFISAESGRRYNENNLRLAEELAYRASLAIENAQLYQVAQHDRAKAEAANRIKDEFLAVLSHELRSPLNPILGWTKLLRAGRLPPAKTEQALETIERNAKLQAQLIEDLLDVSRILRGKMTLNIAPVNLIPTIESALETVRLAAEAKAIDMRFEVRCGTGRAGKRESGKANDTETYPSNSVSCPPLMVMGDPARLQQVIWNLLSNAIKFTPEGGKIQVRLEQFESGRGEDGERGRARITVTDTGKGISPDFLPYVFDYFRQEDGTTTRQFGGLGLGLAIVRHFTELHGGTVYADSPGQNLGATFTLCLPLQRDEKPMIGRDRTLHTESLSLSKVLTNLRILVVDDEVDMRELATYTLTQAGAQVTTAQSATEALAILDQFVPNLLLCDIGMPGVDGYELIRQIRKRSFEQGGTIPAIALTAYAGEMNQQQALTAGFQLHISKPVEPEQLVKAISSLMLAST